MINKEQEKDIIRLSFEVADVSLFINQYNNVPSSAFYFQLIPSIAFECQIPPHKHNELYSMHYKTYIILLNGTDDTCNFSYA